MHLRREGEQNPFINSPVHRHEQIIVASKFSDVTGDGFADAIFLIATKKRTVRF